MTPALHPSHDRAVARELAEQIACELEIPVDEIWSRRANPRHMRVASISRIEQARRVLYLILRRRRWSTPRIGRACGGVDHTSVISGLRTITGDMAEDEWYRRGVDALIAAVEGEWRKRCA